MRIFLFVVASVVLSFANQANAARYVPASISLNGKTILEGSTGDRGTIDADGVWDYLKTMKFKPTKHFVDLKVDSFDNKFELTGNNMERHEGSIVVEIQYGGRAFVRELEIVRVPKDKNGKEWVLDPKQVDEMFNDRYIRRSKAAALKNPKASRK